MVGTLFEEALRRVSAERKRDTERKVGRERERERESTVGVSIHFPALPRVAAALFYETN